MLGFYQKNSKSTPTLGFHSKRKREKQAVGSLAKLVYWVRFCLAYCTNEFDLASEFIGMNGTRHLGHFLDELT